MQIDTEEILLDKCRKLIEERLGWGNSDEWTTQDYETLSRKILEKTNINLSIATLKRIWGKIRYDSKPTITTLNTLAQYLDFENWRSFRQRNSTLSGNGHVTPTNGQGHKQNASEGQEKLKSDSMIAVIGAVSVMVFMAAILYYFFGRSGNGISSSLDPALYSFSSKKTVDEGLPNSVIFDYDASSASPADSIFIQQSWDKKLSTLVSRNERHHTSLYYYPGFFEAKLRVNDSVVREHKLFIKTKGWLPLVRKEGVPVYYKQEDIRQAGFVRLDLEKLRQNNIQIEPSVPWVEYHYFTDFRDIRSPDFVFETEFKNEYSDGSGACQMTEVMLMFEGASIVIPLSAKGCVSKLNFTDSNGKKMDPSPLGCDFSKWVKMVIQTKDSVCAISVNGTEFLKFRTSGLDRQIVGFTYRFQGTGSVDYVRIRKSDGTVVFEENF